MLSNWKVREVDVAGSTFYQIYRDTDAAKKSERIETYGGYWTTEKEAADLAKKMNEVRP